MLNSFPLLRRRRERELVAVPGGVETGDRSRRLDEPPDAAANKAGLMVAVLALIPRLAYFSSTTDGVVTGDFLLGVCAAAAAAAASSS